MAASPAGVRIAGDEVRKRRQLLGVNLRDFAPRCEISKQYLSHIEIGARTHVSPAVFVRICDALGIQPKHRESLVKRDAA